jgi:hypothetical protein
MFSWLRRVFSPGPAKPATKPANPGIGHTAKIAFANGERSWTEEIDVVEAATRALTECGYSVTSHGRWVEHAETGFTFHPQLVELHPLEKGGVRTVTTVEIRHPRLIPEGIFEYQHAAGENSQGSVFSGIEQWVKLDFVPLLEALRDKPAQCMTMEMTFPPKDASPELTRRAVLGPVAHYAEQPPAKPDDATGSGKEEHPFCPCCLLTNSFEAFKSFLESDGFCGIRLYAARDENGKPQADCRVNGGDWEAGAQALRNYVKTWPPRGFEFRKQYVVLQTLSAPTGSG